MCVSACVHVLDCVRLETSRNVFIFLSNASFRSITKNKQKNISFEENSVPPSHQEALILVFEVYDPGGRPTAPVENVTKLSDG